MALNKTAFSKRADQLKRFEESETNRQSILPKNISDRKVRFSSGCIFLASCVAGEKDEVLNMLNCGGADIDTANIDGLTALHQVIIPLYTLHLPSSHLNYIRTKTLKMSLKMLLPKKNSKKCLAIFFNFYLRFFRN